MEKLLEDIRLPRMVPVRQTFPRELVEDIPAAIRAELSKDSLAGAIRPGQRVAVTAGSRGIANIPLILREIVSWVKGQGAHPFLIPAMGSHGGATAAGQLEILADLGITPEAVGAPIRATMDVVRVGTSPGGHPVCIDRFAQEEADAILLVGRVKPHTSFRGPYESGLAKMVAIGLGKQVGADICHSGGMEDMSARIGEMARVALASAPIVLGVAVLENAYDETMGIVALPGSSILEEEPALLELARANMPSILFPSCDVLVVEEMGKNISGTGMDPNIIRRHYMGNMVLGSLAQRIVVLSLTRESHGNANGMGNADVCTRAFLDRIDFQSTYANPLTSRVPASVKIPMVMETEELAIKAAVKTCWNLGPGGARIIRIRNTLQLGEILVSENMADAHLGSDPKCTSERP
ncbi:lactate racemase domain-containing protein [Anaerotalea alkaliphila]|uniref:DUF2088 domain-containing protein n=1 Tax=Anaerotalea alkaliphila TaxID=2662126 RepID=A0A7X5HV82_9FIRM|nr:lactate racemase domain-containing protein [Anaerotalea alkaliphila]NDL67258.1 DUF2088 domain-containing protein [Anaerotalea alkaliphila]